MKVYLTLAPYGALALGEDGSLLDHEAFPKRVDDAVEEALALDRGEVPQGLLRLAERHKDKVLVVEDEATAGALARAGISALVEHGARPFRAARERMSELALSIGFLPSREELYNWIYELELEYTRRKLRKAAAKRDLLAIQSIRAIDDIDKIINMLATRVREWYGVHFPELDELVKEHEEYVRLVSEVGHRDNFTPENLYRAGLSGERAEKLAKAAEGSVGADMSETDVEAVATLARIVRDLYDLRAELTQYTSDVMEEVAPNVTALVGPLLGARLLSLAGSLEEAAKMPASTIQVLGAEKALFRALRTGGRPPKHGVIFQYPEINKSPKWQRGKIARALAAKLAIAVKIDAFTGRKMGDKLREELEKRIEEIKKVYAQPPARKEARPQKPERERPPRFKGKKKRR
ncbi:MAG: C/D box methylation guide ribonucleoprotein complex aNOP56 subunit [Acidilobaceae archaeon]|nr:C/D box methylation guide ribonucleoprotein complex aNOP56 subunit [Acidilobaceae archaeon]